MQRLSAIDAIAPAFTRAQEVVLQPFRLGRSWKLAASSYLAYCGSIFLPFPLLLLLIPRFSQQMPRATILPVWIIGSTFSLVYLVLIYACARMELVEFELLVTRAKFIAPIWRKYPSRVWQWIVAKVILGTLLCALFSPLLYARGRQLFDMSLAQRGAGPDPASFSNMMSILLHFYAAYFAFFLVLKLLATLLNDFVLPFYVLEDLSLLSAMGRGGNVIRRDPLQVALYLLLKPVFAVLGFILQYIASLVCLIPIAIVFGVLGGVAFTLFRSMGGAGHLVLVAVGIVLYLAAVGLFMFVLIGLFGYLLTLLDAYAIFFVGGRYPLLGKLLEPGPDTFFTPPPVFPSREEEEDNDDPGPPMPLDPALA